MIKKLFIALALLATISAVFTSSSLSEIDLIMETMKGKPNKELFKVFHFLHKKTYSLNSNEGLKRYTIFKENLKWVNEKNAKLGKEVYGITKFFDLTDEEFRKDYLMDPVAMQNSIRNSRNIPSAKQQNKASGRKLNWELNDEEEIPEPFLGQTPSRIDWRHMLLPAKDQKSCGSCWAFAAVAAIEGAYKINFQKQFDLSEQYLVDCDTEDGGCNGGWPTRTFEWLKSNGVVETKERQYQGKQIFCSLSKFRTERKNLIKGVSSCEKDVKGKECTKELWLKLLAKGPVVVAMDASDEGFGKYKPKNEEPWVPAKCDKVNHAVTAVGFVTENNEDYLIVRNSWGVGWGFAGHFKVPLSKHCGILDYAWLPEVQKEGEPFPQPVCPTFYSECGHKGKQVSSCEGVRDLNATIGGKAMSFKNNNSKEAPYFNFFTQPQCKGKAMWNYENFECTKDHWNYETNNIISGAPDLLPQPSGCIQHFDQPCFTGNRTLICNSIENLTASGFAFTAGSIYFSPYDIKALIFFENVKFQGKALGIKNKANFNTQEVAGLDQIIVNAKSFLLVPRPRDDPYTPEPDDE